MYLVETNETINVVYMVSEYIPNGMLLDFVLNRMYKENIPENIVRKIALQLIDALHVLNTNLMTHRDLKLDNLMLDDQLNVRIIDFGQVGHMAGDQIVGQDHQDGKDYQQVGTLGYLSPELYSLYL